MYWKGLGVPQNDREAFNYWGKAAEQGHTGSFNELGFCYRYGRGTALDMNRAVECYQKAAQLGVPAAQYELGTRTLPFRELYFRQCGCSHLTLHVQCFGAVST